MWQTIFVFIVASISTLCLAKQEQEEGIRCGHDLEGGNHAAKSNKIDVIHNSDINSNSQLSIQSEDVTSTWSNMRIYLNYGLLDANTALTTAEKQIVKNAMQASINFFYRTIRLDNVESGLNFLCSNYRLTCTDCDLALRVTASDCSYKASASGCASDSATGRAVGGTINWCYNAIRSSIWGRDVEIAVHEIIHVLGFSSSSFDDWLDAPYGTRRGNNAAKYLSFYTGSKYSLVTPLVVQTMQEHFNCPSAQGAALEENGGAGSASSHWDYRYFLGDLMCAKSNDAVDLFSKMTAAALEDSNWYRINWDYIGDWRYAKNEGCNFLTGSCYDTNGESAYPEYFCDSINSNGCWWDRTVAHSPCVLSISNTCPYQYPNDLCGYEWSDYCGLYRLADTIQTSQDTCMSGSYSNDQINSGSQYGTNSRCTISTIGINGNTTSENGRCYAMECLNYDVTNKYYNNIKVNIGNDGTNVICSRDDSNNLIRKTITSNTYYGEIECPPIDIICGTNTQSFGCLYGNYNDELSQCVCNVGYTGTKCDQYDNAIITTTTSTTTTSTTTTTTKAPITSCCKSRTNARCNDFTTSIECEKRSYTRKQCYWDTTNPLCV